MLGVVALGAGWALADALAVGVVVVVLGVDSLVFEGVHATSTAMNATILMRATIPDGAIGLDWSLPVKLPEKLPPVPRLMLESARWAAVCGRCLARSRIVAALTEREAWNEIASAEGWCVYEPGEGFEAYPICLACADASLDDEHVRKAR